MSHVNDTSFRSGAPGIWFRGTPNSLEKAIAHIGGILPFRFQFPTDCGRQFSRFATTVLPPCSKMRRSSMVRITDILPSLQTGCQYGTGKNFMPIGQWTRKSVETGGWSSSILPGLTGGTMTATTGDRIKQARLSIGLSQSDLARRIGVKPQTIQA